MKSYDGMETSLRNLQKRFLQMCSYLEIESKRLRFTLLEKKMAELGFWDDAKLAQECIEELKTLKACLLPYGEIEQKIQDVEALWKEAFSEGEEALIEELSQILDEAEKQLSRLEFLRMLSGEMDANACYLSINAGAGGTEACDWAQMLLRMYERWSALRKWSCSIVDRTEGEVAGIRSVTLKIEGAYAYGYAKAERGVHRLVRISPFDSGARRHTSFASVDVTPEVDENIEIKLRSEDIRVDTFRASGAGGQHINTTDSAVRMTHIPTRIVVSCQNERSQIQNRETCMKLLRSRLYDRELEEREKKKAALAGEKRENAWGSQIRSYVLQPYRLVKDTRTQWQEGNVQAVLDGEIDSFIEAYLKEKGK